MKSKKNCWNCKITLQKLELHNKDYLSLKDLAGDIGLSYSIIADISSGRKKNKNYTNFIYQPVIEINRIKVKEILI